MILRPSIDVSDRTPHRRHCRQSPRVADAAAAAQPCCRHHSRANASTCQQVQGLDVFVFLAAVRPTLLSSSSATLCATGTGVPEGPSSFT